MRPSWDHYFMGIALQVASRATCDRASVGCLLVRDCQILVSGYNGAPRGLPHCDEAGHLLRDGHCVRAVHAEANSLIQAALHGVSTVGATCYATHFPCLRCTLLLVNAGISRLVYYTDYRPDAEARTALDMAAITVEQLNGR